MKRIHVVKCDDQWKLHQDDYVRSSGNFSTQKEAIDRAREIAIKQKEELAIHGVDGKIRATNSYGNDPFPPRG